MKKRQPQSTGGVAARARAAVDAAQHDKDAEAAIEKIIKANVDGLITDEEASERLDNMYHPAVGKMPRDCNDHEMFIIAVWYRQKGDESMRRYEEAMRELQRMTSGAFVDPGTMSIH